MPNHPFITIIGNVATGKSTMSGFLSGALNAHLIKADELYKTNPFFQDAVVDRSRWSLASDVWFLIKRVDMAASLDTLRTEQPVIQDSGLLMSWVYANSRLGTGTMNEQETELYNELYKNLTKTSPKESLVIYLNLPVSMLLEKIKERGRDFEVKHHSEEYLQSLDKTLHELVSQLRSSNTQILEYTQENWCDIVGNTDDQKRLIQEVKNLLPSLS